MWVRLGASPFGAPRWCQLSSRSPRSPRFARRGSLDHGLNVLDTPDVYGPHAHELLIGQAIAGRRQDVFIATKFGITRDPASAAARLINGRPDYVKASCDASLKRLGLEQN